MTELMYYTLIALRTPIPGENILTELASLSHGRLRPGPGTLVALLTQLEGQKFIMLQPVADGKGWAYRITAEGLAALKREYALLQTMVRDGSEYAARWPQ